MIDYANIKRLYSPGGEFTQLSGGDYTGYVYILSGAAYIDKTNIPLLPGSTFETNLHLSNYLKNRDIYETLTLPYSESDVLFAANDFLTRELFIDKLTKLHDNNTFVYSKLFMANNDLPALAMPGTEIEDYSYACLLNSNSTTLTCTKGIIQSVPFVVSNEGKFRELGNIRRHVSRLKDEIQTDYTIFAITSSGFTTLSGNSSTCSVLEPHSIFIESEENELTFGSLYDITLSKNFIFITDEKNSVIYKYDISGYYNGDLALGNKRNLLEILGGDGPKNAINLFKGPKHITSNDEVIVIYDSGNNVLKVFDLDFNYITRISSLPLFKQPLVAIKINEFFNTLYAFTKSPDFENRLNLYIIDLNCYRILEIYNNIDVPLQKTEVVNNVEFSKNNSDYYYISTDRQVYKLYVSKPNVLIGRYQDLKLDYVSGTNLVKVGDAVRTITPTPPTSTPVIAPTIATHPQSQTVTQGSRNVGFSVTCNGTNLIYQWRKNGNPISNATLPYYIIPSVLVENAGDYDVIITNSKGNVRSNIAKLTVNLPQATIVPTPPGIVTQPANRTVTRGSSTGFSVMATGTNLAFQWRRNENAITGANASSYSIQAAQSNDAGDYDVLIFNDTGSIRSAKASLVVNLPPTTEIAPDITINPTSRIVTLNDNVSFSVTASGTNLAYQWKRNGVNVTGATSPSYSIAQAQVSNAGDYTVVVSNSLGSEVSDIAALVVNLPPSNVISPTIKTQPVKATVSKGQNVGFTVVAEGTNISYQWRKNGKDIPGAIYAFYNISNTQQYSAGLYSVLVYNTAGSVTSNSVELIVDNPPAPVNTETELKPTTRIDVTWVTPSNQWYITKKPFKNSFWTWSGGDPAYKVETPVTVPPPELDKPVVTTSPADQTVTEGTSVGFSVVANGKSLSYKWRRNGSVISGATGSSYNISNSVKEDSGYYDVIVYNAAYEVTSKVASLIVDPVPLNPISPVITSNPVDRTIMRGENVGFSVVATGTSLSYQWRRNGSIIPGAISSTYVIENAQSSNAGGYDVVVYNTVRSIISRAANLVVNIPQSADEPPIITKQPVNQTVNVGGQTSLNVIAQGTGLNYQWRKGKVPINGASSASYNISNAELSDYGDYDVVVSNTAGSVVSNTAVILVNTIPTIINLPSFITHPTSLIVRQKDNSGFTVVASGTGLFYQWRKNEKDIPGAVYPSYNILNTQTTDEGYYDVVVYNSAGRIISNTALLTVTVLPIATETEVITPSIELVPIYENKYTMSAFNDVYKGINFLPTRGDYDSVVFITDGRIYFFNEPNTFKQVVKTSKMFKFGKANMSLSPEEYIQASTINKEIYKVARDIIVIKNNLVGRFTGEYDTSNIFTLTDYNYNVDFNAFALVQPEDYYVHENEKSTVTVINRAFKNILTLQQKLIDLTSIDKSITVKKELTIVPNIGTLQIS